MTAALSLGLVQAGAGLYLESLQKKPIRGIYGADTIFIPHAVFDEGHEDNLDITDHPIESGASISDHAYKKPAEVTIHCGWSLSPNKPSLFGVGLATAAALSPVVQKAAAVLEGASAVASLLSSNGDPPTELIDIYSALVRFQNSRVPFDLYTGKRVYKNMVLKTLSVSTDQSSENSLMATLICREILFATTTIIKVSTVSAASADSKKTPVSKINSGTKTLRLPK